MKQPLVPIAELPTSATHEGGESPIIWDVDPGAYVDHDNIFFDTVQAGRMLKVAGFCGMRVGQYVSEATSGASGAVHIGGVGADGTLTASMTGVAKKEPLSKGVVVLREDEQKRCLDYQRPLLSISVDRSQTGQTISHYTGRGMSRTAAWAKVYDRAIREEIIRSSRELNIKMPFKHPRGWGSSNLMPTLAETCLAAELLTSGSASWASTAVLLYGVQLGAEMFINKHRTGWHALPERRWSVLPGDFQPDRFAYTYLSAKAGRLLVARA